MKFKFIILGAGPSGLTFANKLQQSGEKSFIVLEKESVAGGLCRSEIVDGTALDIGGGHFLDVRRPDVVKFLFQFMPKEEWNIFNRDSKIIVGKNIVDHPIEANIWQMEIPDQVAYLKSIATAGCNLGIQQPQKFIDWIYWKLGTKIAEDYMIPYNTKMFSKDLNNLGTYWLEKLPSVSFEETLLSCLERKPYGTQPGHAQFYYPKNYAYGELWLRMAEAIKNSIEYNFKVNKLDLQSNSVNGQYSGDYIINTIPWTEYDEIVGLSWELKLEIKKLKHNSVQIDYYKENNETSAHWLYCPDQSLSYHRILVRHNFCANSNGYWTETNSERIGKENSLYSYLNNYAYPLNTIEKPMIMKRLLAFLKQKNVYGLGRWGEWNHYNSDVTVELALKLAKEFNY